MFIIGFDTQESIPKGVEAHYVYKITFEEVPHFYIGVRKCPLKKTVKTDPYMGSPCTNKVYWNIYTPRKQILAVYSSRSMAFKTEEALIRQNWKNKYCLNRIISGEMHRDVLSQNGKRVAEIWHQMVTNDEELKKWREDNARKHLTNYHEARKSDEELNADFVRQCSENGKKTGKINISSYNDKMKQDPALMEQYGKVRRNNGRNRKGMIWINNGKCNKMIWPEKLKECEDQGFTKGRINLNKSKSTQ